MYSQPTIRSIARTRAPGKSQDKPMAQRCQGPAGAGRAPSRQQPAQRLKRQIRSAARTAGTDPATVRVAGATTKSLGSGRTAGGNRSREKRLEALAERVVKVWRRVRCSGALCRRQQPLWVMTGRVLCCQRRKVESYAGAPARVAVAAKNSSPRAATSPPLLPLPDSGAPVDAPKEPSPIERGIAMRPSVINICKVALHYQNRVGRAGAAACSGEPVAGAGVRLPANGDAPSGGTIRTVDDSIHRPGAVSRGRSR